MYVLNPSNFVTSCGLISVFIRNKYTLAPHRDPKSSVTIMPDKYVALLLSLES